MLDLQVLTYWVSRAVSRAASAQEASRETLLSSVHLRAAMMFIITKETAEAYQKSKAAPAAPRTDTKAGETSKPAETPPKAEEGQKPGETKKPEQLTFSRITWTGEVPWQKWSKFYTAVISKLATSKGLKLKVSVEINPEGGISKQKVEETKASLRELGMNDELTGN